MNRSGWYACLFSVCVLSTCLHAGSHEMGVWGAVYPVLEVDMAAYMAAQLRRIPVKKMQDQLRASVSAWLSHLPAVPLPEASQRRYTAFDPSVTVGVGASRKRLNPLDWVWPDKKWLIIRGDSASHWSLVRRLYGLYPGRFWVLVVGMPFKQWQRVAHDTGMPPVFYAFARILSRFQISHLPTLMGPGCHQQAKRVLEWALPADTPVSVIKATIWASFENRACR